MRSARRTGAARVAHAAVAGVAAMAAMAAMSGMAQADVDWQTGMVTARGVGVANRAAPNPATARGPARRLAEDAARRQLAAQVVALPLAGGGTVADRTKDAATRTRLDRAVADALVITAELQTDGSWVLVMGVPTEAVRQALVGARAITLGVKEAGPPVIVVDGFTSAPAIGWSIATVGAATLHVTAIPAWAKGAPHAKVSAITAAEVTIAGSAGTPSTLFLLLSSSTPGR